MIFTNQYIKNLEPQVVIGSRARKVGIAEGLDRTSHSQVLVIFLRM